MPDRFTKIALVAINNSMIGQLVVNRMYRLNNYLEFDLMNILSIKYGSSKWRLPTKATA